MYNKFNTIQLLRNENHVILYKNIRLKDIQENKQKNIKKKVKKIKHDRINRKGGTTTDKEIEKMLMGLKDGQEMKIINDNLNWFNKKKGYNIMVMKKIQKNYNKSEQMKKAMIELKKGFYLKILKLGVCPKEEGLM